MDFYTNRLYIRPVSIEDNKSMIKYRSDSETNNIPFNTINKVFKAFKAEVIFYDETDKQ